MGTPLLNVQSEKFAYNAQLPLLPELDNYKDLPKKEEKAPAFLTVIPVLPRSYQLWVQTMFHQ